MLNILGLAKGKRPAQETIAKRASDIQWHLRGGFLLVFWLHLSSISSLKWSLDCIKLES